MRSPPKCAALAAASFLALGSSSCSGGETQAAVRPVEPLLAFPAEAHSLPRNPYELAEAKTVFPEIELAGYLFDPLTGFTLKGNQHYVVEWPEHPDHRYQVRTNSMGMREDREFPDPPPDFLILATGDSHTDGVCNNAESWPHVLEALLSARRPGERVLALNSGVGSYSFHNYVGVLEKHLHLRPKVFVVAVFGGNDFGELLSPWHHFRGTERPSGGPEYYQPLNAAVRADQGRGSHAVSQGYNQYHYFQAYPEQTDVALLGASQAVHDMRLACESIGALLVIAYIPPPAEVEYERFAATYQATASALGMDDALAIAQVRELGHRFVANVRDQGVPVIDCRRIFAENTGRYYWLGDLHIDLVAHRLLARSLAEVIDARVEPAPAAGQADEPGH